MNNLSLYKVQNEFRDLIERALKAEEFDPKLKEEFESNKSTFLLDCQNILFALQTLDNDIDNADKIIEIATKYKKRRQEIKDEIKEQVICAMSERKLKNIESDIFKITLVEKDEFYVSSEVDDVDPEFIVEKVTRSVDKMAIKKAIKETGVIPTCVRPYKSRSLRINN